VGMNDFIPKPFVEDTIRMVFNKWILPVADINGPANIEMNNTEMKEHIDLDKLREIVAGDEALLKEFLSSIENELKKSTQDLENCFQQKDLKGLKSGGHKLKGTTLAAGLDTLSVKAKAIDALTEFDENYIAGLLNGFREETEIIFQIIKKYAGR